MRNVEQIYSDYRIMPALQTHQLRVAAVAKMVCDNFTKPIDAENAVLACLFHDMGNIIKSDLHYFPEFLEPKGLKYWQKVKDDFVQKYNNDVHFATHAIAKEIELPPAAKTYLENIGFSKLGGIAARDSFEIKICSYADMRVGPFGVLSVEERLGEGKKRYAGRRNGEAFAHAGFAKSAAALRQVEKQIFEHENIEPRHITDDAIRCIIDHLRNKTL